MTEFIIGGVIYNCAPLNFYWQRKVQSQYLAALNHISQPSFLSLLDKASDSDNSVFTGDDISGMLTAFDPLADAALAIVATCEEQRIDLANEASVSMGREPLSEVAHTKEYLEKRLLASEIMGVAMALPRWIAAQQPTSGEVAPAQGENSAASTSTLTD